MPDKVDVNGRGGNGGADVGSNAMCHPPRMARLAFVGLNLALVMVGLACLALVRDRLDSVLLERPAPPHIVPRRRHRPRGSAEQLLKATAARTLLHPAFALTRVLGD